MAAAFAISLLKEEFAMGDIESKIRASSRVHLIASVLGPERTSSELFPTLTELVGGFREADEVLYVLVKSVLKTLDHVGDNYTSLCSLLEVLSIVEETTVRDRAVKGLQIVCSRMKPDQVWTDMFPLMKRLAEAEWFTPRRSSCGLLAAVYCGVEESRRSDVLELMKTLVADETPMVRRAVAAAMGGMALAKNGAANTQEHLLPIWLTLTDDPHFSVRAACVSTTGRIIKGSNKDVGENQVLPHCIKLASSRGWRVRFALAGQLGEIAQCLPASASTTPFLNMVVSLCRDFEEEVSEVAVGQIAIIAKAIKDFDSGNGLGPMINALAPVLNQIAEADDKHMESSYKMRRAVALASIGLARIDPKVLGSKLTTVWEALFKDTTRKDSSEVSRTLLEGLDAILASIPSFSFNDMWGKLIMSLYEGSKAKAVDEINSRVAAQSQNQNANNQGGEGLPGDPVETPKWRVRVYILSNLEALLRADKEMAVKLWLGALSDESFEVRVYAGVVLSKLLESPTGASLVESELCPMLVQFYRKGKETKTYQHRIAVVRACEMIKKESTFQILQPVFVEALNDPVSNVMLSALLAAGRNPVAAKLCKESLTGLLSSKELDVPAFAQAALDKAAS